MSNQESKPVIKADPTKGVKVDVGDVSKPFRNEIKQKVAALKKEGIGELMSWNGTHRLSFRIYGSRNKNYSGVHSFIGLSYFPYKIRTNGSIRVAILSLVIAHFVKFRISSSSGFVGK